MNVINRRIEYPEDKGYRLPLLKWAGGKRRLAPEITESFGFIKRKYFEPFLGGGAVFFHLLPPNARLSDVNSELIECYEEIRKRPALVAKKLDGMSNSADDYYRIRATVPRSSSERAARFIYLTTLSFNGIYRQNLRGEFNVPYGWKLNKSLPSAKDLRAYSEILQSVELVHADFQTATEDAGPGDLVYCDPPYTVAHNNNGFVKYNASIFSWEDQQRLALWAEELVLRGCKVVVSNADHYSVRELYKSFRVSVITRASVIAAASEFRSPVTECLFVSEN